MKNRHQPKYFLTHQVLNIIWLLLTLLLLSIVFYYEWQNFKFKKQQEIQLVANEARTKLDKLLDNFIRNVHQLPLFGDISNCDNLLPTMRNLVFNDPFISGIVINNLKTNLKCSSFNEPAHPPYYASESLSLSGPITMGTGKEDTFLLVEPLGNYVVEIYFIQSLITNIFNQVPYHIHFIGLYDTQRKKILIGKRRDLKDRSEIKLPELVQAPLQNLTTYKIVVETDYAKFSPNFILSALIQSLFVFLITFYLFYELKRILNKRNSLKYAIHQAIRSNDFEPVYQPIMNIETNQYCGAEILIRWQTDSDLIMPDLFIEEAEKTGLIIPMTLQVLTKSFDECHFYLKENREFHLSVNVSAKHFTDVNFFRDLDKLCETYDIKSHQLLIELTERELFEEQDQQIIKAMEFLRQKGYTLAIDDFGTGHASIKYLQHFPFNYLKIDKIFVQAIGTGAITESLNESIIHMANRLKLEIIAEGVETEEQVSFLKQSQVKLMQGWYFSKALAYQDMIKLIEDYKND